MVMGRTELKLEHWLTWCWCRTGGKRQSVVGQGLQGLLGGVTAGVTGVVRAPLQGYNDGSGVIAGQQQGPVVTFTTFCLLLLLGKIISLHSCRIMCFQPSCLQLPAATSEPEPQLVSRPFPFDLLPLGVLFFAVLECRSFGSSIMAQTPGCAS